MIKPSRSLYYLGQRDEQLEDRSTARCDVVPECECSGGCGTTAPGGSTGGNPPPSPKLLHSYYTGGSANNLLSSATDGLNFATEIMQALPSASLSLAKWVHAGFSNGRTCHFAGGTHRTTGTIGLPNAFTATSDAIDLSTDTSSAESSLNTARGTAMGVGNQDIGYVIGGYGTSVLALYAEAYDYATGTYTNQSGTMQSLGVFGTEQLVYEAGETSNLTHGYILGGVYWITPVRISSIDVVTFATATVSTMGSSSSELRSDIAAAGNATVGYYLGGDKSVFPSSELTVTQLVESLTYATDSLAVTSSTSFKIMDASATGTDTYLYMCGGYLGDVAAAWLSGCSRVEYATGTLSEIASATLTSGPRSSMEAAGTSFY